MVKLKSLISPLDLEDIANFISSDSKLLRCSSNRKLFRRAESTKKIYTYLLS